MTGTAEWLDEGEQRTWQAFYDMQVLLWRRLSHHLARETGLSEPDFAVLTALAAAPGGRMRPFELSVVTDFEKSRLHHHLTRMVERGLVTRQPCLDAPRGAEIVLTPAGRDAIDGAGPQRAEHVRRWLLEQLTKEQQDALADIAEAVLGNLRAAGRPGNQDDESCAPPTC
ncbi:MarR family winged helix-turn-helix transcriptional regulator [Phytohabitans houttuyneae]|uniref:MarR family transcriptional regulator n=1 Tax=Phytohabitans houttuyneae TaxID=1076126 RepID=A0A6V8K2I3_9ACTN|nr:MarR family winged helix-turn-helix transcriptional regulator [Phytohabitans houttuyneae]GFJ75987.1 MarR family transcriptional regulator [Phytohabitans houttuyneae]